MIDKIIVMPDSFKNTMGSEEVAEIIKKTLIEFDPKLNVSVYPIADGGEGTAVIFSKYLGLELKQVETTNAFGKKINIEYGSNGKIGVIDIASVVGFDANAGEKLDPSVATTYGIGKIIKELINAGHKKIYVGLGGSVTNDLGLGMMSALGVKFYDKDGNNFVPSGRSFADIYNIEVNDFLCDVEIVCLSDVKSPLFGATGAAQMFSRQKGADEKMVLELEENGKKAVSVISKKMGDYSNYQGSGAAGGLGYAFKTFFNAQMNSGIKEILKISNVEKEITENTIIVTGEGKFDSQSVQGKVISGILDMANRKKAKVIIVAGCVEEMEQVTDVEQIFACSPLGRNMEEVKKTCRDDLKRASIELYEYLKNKM